MSSERALPAGLLSALRAVVQPGAVFDERDRLIAYEADALTTSRGLPDAAVFPADRDELIEVIRLLHEARVPFVARGAGTGLAGGAVARGGVLVCTTRMHRILEVDAAAQTALVEPGVLTDAINGAAEEYGLRYLPDPASAAACTIGGNVAMNAGGPHCLKHGVTSDHVAALEVILPDGTPLVVGRGADGGLDLAGIFTGSEGTLGVISRIRVNLAPVAPGVRTFLALFDSVADAGRAVGEIFDAGVVPVALELVDRETIAVVESSIFAAGLPLDTEAALVVECEGDPDEAVEDLEEAEKAVMNCGAREVRHAHTDQERLAIWQARKKAYGALGRLAPDVFVQDAAVPRSTLPDLLPRFAEIARRYDLRIANFFHAGDGNVHPNLLFDRRDPDQVTRVQDAGAEIMALCVEAGGTITGEHGVGADKVRHMGLVFGSDELEIMRAVREATDRLDLANPGKLLPEAVGDLTG
ncbi:MAG: FAD-binding protein [Gemmatimonadetes bacterium]|nr:FAD-binding protein [Gemmatimonadota bacterium]